MRKHGALETSADQRGHFRLGAEGRALVAVAAVVAWVVLNVVMLAAVVLWAAWKYDHSLQEQDADHVEESFIRYRAAYEDAAVLIVALARSEPGAIAVRGSYGEVCFLDAAGEQTCREWLPADPDEPQMIQGATWQAKDEGRVFFRFAENACYLMYDPQERNPRRFARAHGFAWDSEFEDGWSIPCRIEDESERDEMWEFFVY